MIYANNTDRELILSQMVEIDFVDEPEDGFRKVKETLERMGVPKRQEKTLIQSCHILHKRGKYYICHFKELFAMDGRRAELTEEDLARRNLIVKYLKEWELVVPMNNNWEKPMLPPRKLKIIRHGDRDEWNLETKYTIGYKQKIREEG